MRCPYLSAASKKICVRMLELGPDEELTDFDIKHYCTGNPIFCYYFRLPQIEEKIKKQKAKIIFEGEIQRSKRKLLEVRKDIIVEEWIKPKIVE